MFPFVRFMTADYMLAWCAPDRSAMDAVEGRLPARRASVNRFKSPTLSSPFAGSPVPAGDDPSVLVAADQDESTGEFGNVRKTVGEIQNVSC